MPAHRSCSRPRYMRIFTQRRRWRAVIRFLREHGRPKQMPFDHDPELRSAGRAAGIFPRLCAAFYCVYKSNRASVPHISHKKMGTLRDTIARYKEECFNVHWPESLEEVKRVTEEFRRHYNEQRPHQGQACGNQPPRQAFPTLPTLPPLPRTAQADRWRLQLSSSGVRAPDWF